MGSAGLTRPRAGRGLPIQDAVSLLVSALQLAAISYIAAVGGLVWWANAPMLVGWQPRVVLTGSMMPLIRPGDVALIGPAVPTPGGLPKGRIVLVADPSKPSGYYLHRVKAWQGGRIITKGDANPTQDYPAVAPSQIRGQARLLVPKVGEPLVWLRNGDWVHLGGTLGATWLAIALCLGLRRDLRRAALEARQDERADEHEDGAGEQDRAPPMQVPPGAATADEPAPVTPVEQAPDGDLWLEELWVASDVDAVPADRMVLDLNALGG